MADLIIALDDTYNVQSVGDLDLFIKQVRREAAAAERERWATLLQRWAYPFDFHFNDPMPDGDMLEAIAQQWLDDPMGYPGETLAVVLADMREELGIADPESDQ